MNKTNLYPKKIYGKGPEKKKKSREEERRYQTEINAIYAFCKLKSQISCSFRLILRVKSENFKVQVLTQKFFRLRDFRFLSGQDSGSFSG